MYCQYDDIAYNVISNLTCLCFKRIKSSDNLPYINKFSHAFTLTEFMWYYFIEYCLFLILPKKLSKITLWAMYIVFIYIKLNFTSSRTFCININSFSTLGTMNIVFINIHFNFTFCTYCHFYYSPTSKVKIICTICDQILK